MDAPKRVSVRGASGKKTRGQQRRSTISLNDFIPALVNRLAACLVSAFAKEIEDFGISVSEWRVLLALDERSPYRLTELADVTSIDVSTLSRLVRRLDERQLCLVEIYGRDKRIATIELSPSGRKLLSSLLPIGRAYEKALIEGMPAEEIMLCQKTLRLLYGNLRNFLDQRRDASE